VQWPSRSMSDEADGMPSSHSTARAAPPGRRPTAQRAKGFAGGPFAQYASKAWPRPEEPVNLIRKSRSLGKIPLCWG
jgi:hypothetical protein